MMIAIPRGAIRIAFAALLLPLVTGCATLKSADSPVVSSSRNLQMTAADYADVVRFQPPDALRPYVGDPGRTRELVLDVHSDQVLANEALAQGLDKDPLVASRLGEARRKILSTAYMQKLRDAVEVPEDLGPLAQERYLRDKEKLRTLEERKVAHILLTKLPGCTCEKRSLGQRVRDLEKQLKDGADFAALARELSADAGSAKNGGELPEPVRLDSKTVLAFETAVFALAQPGDISEPVATQYGVHLIKLLDIKPSRQIAYEEVESKLKAQIAGELRFSAMERARGEAYPDPTTINMDALDAVMRELSAKPVPVSAADAAPEATTSETKPDAAPAVQAPAEGG